MGSALVLPLAVAVVLLAALPAGAQQQTGSSRAALDAFLHQQNLAGVAFALDASGNAPVAVVEVREIRQMQGRPVFAVYTRSRADEPVMQLTVTAAVVASDGSIKATQRLSSIRNLDPGQTRKQDTEIRTAVPSISDRIAFFVSEVEHASGERWRIDDAELREAVKAIAGRR